MSNQNPEIQDIKIELIDIHPYQKLIRPFSEKYQTFVDQESVDRYAANMLEKGYDRAHPIVVRPVEGGRYQCVVGWQRRTAMLSNGENFIPADVREISEAEAAIDLVQKQGKEVGAWGMALHAHRCVEDQLMSQAEYARAVGSTPPTVNEWIKAARLRESFALANNDLTQKFGDRFTVRLAREVAVLPKEDWGWLTELILEKKWSFETIEKVTGAIKRVVIPDDFKRWLKPKEFKREIALSVGDQGSMASLNDLIQNINYAQGILDKLPDNRTIWVFEDDLPKATTCNLKQRFLEGLVDAKPSSRSQIGEQHNKVLAYVKRFDEKYESWQRQRMAEEEKQKAEEEVSRERLRMEQEFTPIGFHAPIDRLSLEGDSFDVAFLSYPQEEENTHWPIVVSDALKPGGLLVCICNAGDDLFYLSEELVRAQFIYLELRPWIYPCEELGERFYEDTAFIAVYAKPGDSPYLPEASELIQKHGKAAGNNAIAFLKGEDKNSIYPKLIKYLLDCYAAKEAQVFCPSVQDSSIVKAAKSAPEMAYKVTWSCADRATFNTVTREVEAAPFHWDG
jgi:ParB-like chromosome segregation protein Spo0J